MVAEAVEVPSSCMTLRLSVDTAAWNAHVASVAGTYGDLLPVVKGNGYGFGRRELMHHTERLAGDVAVGTAHELTEVPPSLRPFVLTPIGTGVESISRNDAVLAIGSPRDLERLDAIGAKNPVVVKIESSMHRYGAAPKNAMELRKAAEANGHEVVAWSIHLPLSGDDTGRRREILALSEPLAADIPLHVSHVGDSVSELRASTRHRLVVRTGTQLWLGNKSMLSLHTDVIAVRPTRAGTLAGYRNTVVTRDASLIMVGCGSSHGVSALDDGRSPFHFARQRLDMLETPHMHTTMLLADGVSQPHEGDWVDVQQPLTRVYPDVVAWG